MAWKKIPAVKSRSKNILALSIQQNGSITWNSKTQSTLGDPEFVELLIDKKAKRLGLRKAHKSEDNFSVRKAGGQNTWGISAWAALNFMDLLVDSAYRRFAQEENKIIFMDITDLLIASEKRT